MTPRLLGLVGAVVLVTGLYLFARLGTVLDGPGVLLATLGGVMLTAAIMWANLPRKGE